MGFFNVGIFYWIINIKNIYIFIEKLLFSFVLKKKVELGIKNKFMKDWDILDWLRVLRLFLFIVRSLFFLGVGSDFLYFEIIFWRVI